MAATNRKTLNNQAARRPAPETGQIEVWDALLPGFGLRIAAGGARTFFIMKRLHGRLVRRTVGRHPPLNVAPGEPLSEGEYWPAEARERARIMLADLARGIDPKLPPPKKKAVVTTVMPTAESDTFAGVAKGYFADVSKRGGGTLRSKAELERKVKIDLAAWKDRPIGEITRAEVRALIRAKHAVAPIAANRLLALIHRIFRWAVREDLIQANPASDIDAPAQERERDRVLSLDELKRVWIAAEEMGGPFAGVVQLLILTAQRRGEVAGMTRAELVPGPAWRLPDARAKRKAGHLVPLSPLAKAIIDEQPQIGDSPLVFASRRRMDPDEPPGVLGGWSQHRKRLDWLIALDAAWTAEEPDLGTDEAPITPTRRKEVQAKYGIAGWTLHDLRRSTATHLRDADVMGEQRADRLTVSKILNHAEAGMTRLYDRYSSDPEMRKALEAWADVVARLVGRNIVDLHGGGQR